MVYYRVPAALDGYRRIKGPHTDFTTWISGELYTAKELEKIGADVSKFERVEASRKKSYWFFGGRFNANIERNW